MSQHKINLYSSTTKKLGLLLALITGLSLFAMLHHPSVSASNAHDQIHEINSEAPVNTAVHGILIVFTLLISFCLTVYAQTQQLKRADVLLGLLCYWLGSLAMVIAALISGFVVPHLADMYAGANTAQLDIFVGLRRYSWAINQTFAQFGVYGWCTAMGCWAIHMFFGTTKVKLFGAASLMAALTTAAALLSGLLSLHVFGMTLVLTVISIWHLGIAVLLYKH